MLAILVCFKAMSQGVLLLPFFEHLRLQIADFYFVKPIFDAVARLLVSDNQIHDTIAHYKDRCLPVGDEMSQLGLARTLCSHQLCVTVRSVIRIVFIATYSPFHGRHTTSAAYR